MVNPHLVLRVSRADDNTYWALLDNGYWYQVSAWFAAECQEDGYVFIQENDTLGFTVLDDLSTINPVAQTTDYETEDWERMW